MKVLFIALLAFGLFSAPSSHAEPPNGYVNPGGPIILVDPGPVVPEPSGALVFAVGLATVYTAKRARRSH